MRRGKFQGMICPATPSARAAPWEGVLELVGPTGVVEKVSCRERYVDVT
jgi:hypothetical protein